MALLKCLITYSEFLIAKIRTQPLPSNVVRTHNTYQGNCALGPEKQPGRQGGWGHTSVGKDKHASTECRTGADSWARTQPLLFPESPSSSRESFDRHFSACSPPWIASQDA